MTHTTNEWEEPDEYDPAFEELKRRILDTNTFAKHAPQVLKPLGEKAPNGEGALFLVNIN